MALDITRYSEQNSTGDIAPTCRRDSTRSSHCRNIEILTPEQRCTLNLLFEEQKADQATLSSLSALSSGPKKKVDLFNGETSFEVEVFLIGMESHFRGYAEWYTLDGKRTAAEQFMEDNALMEWAAHKKQHTTNP